MLIPYLDIKLLALRVLQEEAEGFLPHRTVGVVDSLERCGWHQSGALVPWKPWPTAQASLLSLTHTTLTLLSRVTS